MFASKRIRSSSSCNILGSAQSLLTRRFTLSPIRSCSERVSLSLPNNESITLDLYYPDALRSLHNLPPAAAVFLPRGPVFSDPAHDASNVSILSSHLHCPVVTINYRCDESHKFPTPVHDVIAGYDWVLKNLVPSPSTSRFGRPGHGSRIATCGELVGGQLATMLALTECRAGEPGIFATALNNPIVDWVAFLGQNDGGMSKGASGEVEETFLNVVSRNTGNIFRRPGDFFDPFASPILFFRTPGMAVPPSPSGPLQLDDMAELTLFEREESLGKHLDQDVDSTNPNEKAVQDSPKAPRKASLRFPGKAFKLRLPEFQITAGKGSPLVDQAKELKHQLQKSFERQSRASAGMITSSADRGVNDWSVAFHEVQGMGLWDDSEAGRTNMSDAARWIASRLKVQ